MNVFVQRDNGRVVAVFANFQEGYADEKLPESHPDVLAFFNPAPSVDDYKAAIVAYLDAKAKERLYDSAVSVATYTGSTNQQWAAEATAFVAWRDAVWAYAYAELDRVLAGQRGQPSVEAFLGELPVIEWPA